MTAAAAGYEMALRARYCGRWTQALTERYLADLLAAAFGTASVTAKALKLSTEQTANALATALAMAGGTRTPEQKGISSRCFAWTFCTGRLVAALSARKVSG